MQSFNGIGIIQVRRSWSKYEVKTVTEVKNIQNILIMMI
nr:hypothetical protein [Raoultella ornithinolytica]